MFKRKLFYLIILLIQIYYTFGQLNDVENDEKMIKKTKVLACIAISRSRITQDSEFIGEMIENINKIYGISDGKSKIVSLSLVNCYGRISSEHAFETISNQVNGEINSLSDENKRLLGLQKSELNAEDMNKDSFINDFQEINNILQDLNEEHNQMKKRDNKRSSSSSNKKEKKVNNEDDSNFSWLNLILSPFINFFNIFNISNFEYDSYFSIAIMITLAFIILNVCKNLCSKKNQKKKVNVNNQKQD